MNAEDQDDTLPAARVLEDRKGYYLVDAEGDVIEDTKRFQSVCADSMVRLAARLGYRCANAEDHS